MMHSQTNIKLRIALFSSLCPYTPIRKESWHLAQEIFALDRALNFTDPLILFSFVTMKLSVDLLTP